MIQGRDIIYISSIEWNFLWQGHQEIALRLAAGGNRVLYVENTGVRSPGLRDAGRVVARARRWARAAPSQGARELAPNIHVCSPVVLPPFGGAGRRALNRRLFLPPLLGAARRLGMREPLVWTYLPNDTTLDLIRLLGTERAGLVYYCVADFSQLTPHPRRLEAAEREIVEAADVVFTSCAELHRKFAPLNAHTYIYPFGVNLDAFPFEERASVELNGSNGNGAATPGPATPAPASPAFVASLPRPVIGYVGGMHRHVDFGLIREMALRRPDWSWVCVGALQAATGDLAGLPNVHLTGQRPHDELADYVHGFDVCVVPYVDSRYTATVVPTKINEYLAVGKPVVSTALPPVCEFNEEHPGVLLTAEPKTESFLAAVERALQLPRDEETRRRRRRVAEQADWGVRFREMCDLVEAQVRARGAWQSPGHSL